MSSRSRTSFVPKISGRQKSKSLIRSQMNSGVQFSVPNPGESLTRFAGVKTVVHFSLFAAFLAEIVRFRRIFYASRFLQSAATSEKRRQITS